MHAVIFLGFMTLLVRKVQLLIIGYDENFVYAGLAGQLFAGFKDVIEIAVLAAVGYALWNVWLETGPARAQSRRALILSLIAAIMITDLLFDGFRFACCRIPTPALRTSDRLLWQRVRRALQRCPTSSLSPDSMVLLDPNADVLSFLVILPVGEHFHIVTALPALFFAVAARRIAFRSSSRENHGNR